MIRCACGFVMPNPFTHGRECKLFDPAIYHGSQLGVAKAARCDALEEAAKLCEARAAEDAFFPNDAECSYGAHAARWLASAIRELADS